MPALNRSSLLIALPLLLVPFAVQAGTIPSYNITVIGPAGSTATAFDLASPVPEPATAGMLLAGAGLLGFRNRRKVVAA